MKVVNGPGGLSMSTQAVLRRSLIGKIPYWVVLTRPVNTSPA